jgi:hypothetical protein
LLGLPDAQKFRRKKEHAIAIATIILFISRPGALSAPSLLFVAIINPKKGGKMDCCFPAFLRSLPKHQNANYDDCNDYGDC